jgi:hypothetical protein
MRGAIASESRPGATERIGDAARSNKYGTVMSTGQPCGGERMRVVRVNDIEFLLMQNFFETEERLKAGKTR